MKYYHSSDPIENFKLRIKIKEIARVHNLSNNVSSNEEINQPAYQSIEILKWQEKRYTPSELSSFLSFKQSGRLPFSRRQREIDQVLLDLEKEKNQQVDRMLNNIMIYTYIDKDNKIFDKPAPVVNQHGREATAINYLGAAVDHNLENSKRENRFNRIQRRLQRDGFTYKEMHICIGTDINIEILKSGNTFYPEHHVNEQLLCNVRIYEDGLIEISPGLSDVLEEPQDDNMNDTEKPIIPNIFTSNKTVIHAVDKGFRLSTYKFRSKTGCEYEYSIENLNEVLIPKLLDDIRSKEGLDDSILLDMNSGEGAEEEGYKNDWKQDPPPDNYDISLSLYAEIVCAWGFEYDNIYISYEVILPDGWLVRSGNLGDGVAEKDFENKFGSTAKEVLLNDGYADGDDAVGMLHGTTSIVTSNSLSNGLFLPYLRSKWKGKCIGRSIGKVSGYLIGITIYIITVIAIILGVDYPFWIVPGLVLFIGLYTGVPAAPIVQAAIVDYTNGKKSYYGLRKMQGQFVDNPKSHINHLINLNFDVKLNNQFSISANQEPYILFEIHSVGIFGRHRLQGYGYCPLPIKNDNQYIEVNTWKPIVGDYANMNEFFLGGSTRLRDIAFAQIPDKNAFSINKFGIKTESSGTISFRYHSILVNPKKSQKYIITNNITNSTMLATDRKSSKQTVAKQQQLRRTVDDILNTYKLSTLSKSMSISSSKASDPSPAANLTISRGSLVSSSSDKAILSNTAKKNAIMDVLNANDRASKVAEMLALAKAKAYKKVKNVAEVSENDSSQINRNDNELTNNNPDNNSNNTDSLDNTLPRDLVIPENIINRNLSQGRYSNVDVDTSNDSNIKETDKLLSNDNN